MALNESDPGDPDPAGTGPGRVEYLSATVDRIAKILVVGAFGTGKTTLVGAVSEIRALHTEETMSEASTGVDDLAGLDHKTTTTVALDFGRITLNDQLVLYLFGTPGQRRFWDMWAGLAQGVAGVLVLVDARRLTDSFEVLGQLEEHGLEPFAVAVNQFPDSPDHPPEALRAALDLLPETPLVYCDARDRASTINALKVLIRHALARATSPTSLTAPGRSQLP
ncbi:GTP-binding protein [Spirillospora sp. NBC_01491]|uniref:GTP-binding protein n=1 Tax=Spirillospora sp. NBC_01491 TaxID=2976007 RepID=UPI002E3467B0|nr:ATP/GTP-binding protein [Spirillospora sp. NBC_01491]